MRRQKTCFFFRFDFLARFAPGVCSFCFEEVDSGISFYPTGKGTTRLAVPRYGGGERRGCIRIISGVVCNVFAGRSVRQVSIMIFPQVYLWKFCYDFFFF